MNEYLYTYIYIEYMYVYIYIYAFLFGHSFHDFQCKGFKISASGKGIGEFQSLVGSFKASQNKMCPLINAKFAKYMLYQKVVS